MSRPALLAGVAAFAGVVASPLAAQEANYNDIIPGARAAAMGGAFTAIADDSTASFHNPAGLTQISSQGLSLSVSAYGFQRTNLRGVLSSGSERVDLQLDSLLFYPSASAYVMPLPSIGSLKHTAALSVIVPDFFEFEGVQDLDLESLGLVADVFQSRKQQTLWLGPSYAVQAGPLAVGVSVFVQYVTFNEKAYTAITFASEVAGETAFRLMDFEFSKGTFFGLSAVFGVRYEPFEWLSLGLRSETPNVRITGSAKTFFAETESLVSIDDLGDLTSASLFQDVFRDVKGDTQYRTPASVSFGVATHYPESLTLALDIDFFFHVPSYDFVRDGEAPVVDPQPAELPGLEDERGFAGNISDPGRATVINVALGADWKLSPEYSLQFGAYTDISAVPNRGLFDREQIDLYGGSFGLTKTGEDTILTAGFTGRMGSGRTAATRFHEDGGSEDIATKVRQWSVMAFIGGATTLFDDDDVEGDETYPREESANP